MPSDVSVVIPAYNREKLVAQAVASCLAQQAPQLSIEVVVVDDGSTDSTREVLLGFGGRIRLIALGANRGRNHARNAGLAAATGQYVKFLDSDDVLIDGSLAKEVALARASDADIVACGWDEVVLEDAAGERAVHMPAPDFPQDHEGIVDALLAGVAVPTGAALYSRQLAGNLRWDVSLRKLDDWDWFVRAALQSRRVASLRAASYAWRQHEAQGVISETLLLNAIEHHAVLHKLEAWLRERGLLSDARARRLAQYFYKELRVLALQDRERFEGAVRHILELDPRFQPRDEERQGVMRGLAACVGFRRAVLLHSAIKRAARRLRGLPEHP